MISKEPKEKKKKKKKKKKKERGEEREKRKAEPIIRRVNVQKKREGVITLEEKGTIVKKIQFYTAKDKNSFKNNSRPVNVMKEKTANNKTKEDKVQFY